MKQVANSFFQDFRELFFPNNKGTFRVSSYRKSGYVEGKKMFFLFNFFILFICWILSCFIKFIKRIYLNYWSSYFDRKLPKTSKNVNLKNFKDNIKSRYFLKFSIILKDRTGFIIVGARLWKVTQKFNYKALDQHG